MSGWDVSDADMPNIPGSQRADVPELPDGALDALLTGDLVTDEACTGLQPAAALLAALNAAPQDGELAGHARVLAEFRRRGLPVHARRSARRRPRLLTSLLTAKAAAAAAVAAVALGGVAAAAYTGTLPAPAQQFAHGVIGAPSPSPSAQLPSWHPAAQPPSWHPAGHPGPHGCRRPGRHRPGGVRAVHRLRPREGAWHGHPRRRWRSATWRRQPAARPRSPPTAQRCPTRAARSPAPRPRPQPTRPASTPHTPPGSHRRTPPPTRPALLLAPATHQTQPVSPRDPPRAGTGGARRHGAAGCSSHLQAARRGITERGRPTYPARRPRPLAVPDPRLRRLGPVRDRRRRVGQAWEARRIATMFSGITRPGRFSQAGRDKRPPGLWPRRCRRLGAVAGRRGVTVTRSPALVLL